MARFFDHKNRKEIKFSTSLMQSQYVYIYNHCKIACDLELLILITIIKYLTISIFLKKIHQ